MNILDPEFDYTRVPDCFEEISTEEAIFQLQQQTACTAAWAASYYCVLRCCRVTIPEQLLALGLDRDSAFIAAHAYLDYAVLFITGGLRTQTIAERLEYPCAQACSVFNVVALASIHTLLDDVTTNIGDLASEQGLPAVTILDITTEELISQARAMAPSSRRGHNPFISDTIYALLLGATE